MRLGTFLAAALLLLPAAGLADPGFKVIVHRSNPADTLPKDELAQMFLKKVTQWPSGKTVAPAQPPEQSPARDRFAQEVMGKSAATLKAYWNRLVFAGREVPPLERASDDEVVAYVRNNEGAIGYVAATSDTTGVKILGVK